MKIFSFLFGLMFIGMMSCVGFGQAPEEAVASANCHGAYNVAILDLEAAEGAMASRAGVWAAAIEDKNETNRVKTECAVALMGPHFDVNYNTDVNMPAIREGFNSRYNGLVADINTETTATNTAKTADEASIASLNSLIAVARNDLNTWKSRLDYRDYTWWTIYSYANILSGLTAVSEWLDILEGSINNTSVADGKAAAWDALRKRAEKLRDDINAY
jgi:hypothetical protein